MGATVIEFRFFNQIAKKKKKNIAILCFYEYRTYTSSNYIKFLIGVNLHGNLHLDVIRIKLKLKVKIGFSLSMVE